jgi:hypothetical protein
MEEDLAAFLDAQHNALDNHALGGGPLFYVGLPHIEVGGLETCEVARALLDMLFVYALSPAFTFPTVTLETLETWET